MTKVALNLYRECLRKRNRRSLTRCATILWGVFIISGSAVFAQQNVGLVLEMHGKWTYGDTQGFLKLGQLLPGNVLLANTAPVDDDRIVIANLHGEVIKTVRCKDGVCRECSESGACYDPIHPLPKAEESTSRVSTLLDAVLELFVEKPERYSVHRVRGADTEVTKTQVNRLEGNIVELGSFLEGREKGRYDIQFVPIYGKTNNGAELQTLQGEINWNPGERAILAVDGIKPGLYKVHVYRGASIATAWILLCAGEEYKQSNAAFQEFVHQTQVWGKNVTPETKQAYQRAYLDYLYQHRSRLGE